MRKKNIIDEPIHLLALCNFGEFEKCFKRKLNSIGKKLEYNISYIFQLLNSTIYKYMKKKTKKNTQNSR